MHRPESFRRHPMLLAYSVASGVLSLVLALSLSGQQEAGIVGFEWTALGAIISIGSFIAAFGLWTTTGVYAAVFWCFHFGLISVVASGLAGSAELSAWDQSWVFGPFAGEAALLALIGSLAFASGAGLARARHPYPCGERRQHGTYEPAHPHGVAGAVLVAGALVLWCAIIISSGGLRGFFVSYAEHLQLTADLAVGTTLVWLVSGCGLVLCVTGQRGSHRVATIVAWACLALVALPLGLRGEILFATLAALVGLARCGKSLPPGKVAAFGLALLLLIPVLRDVRALGLAALPDTVLSPPSFGALIEMGGSLHPVEKVVRWHSEGEPYQFGNTYWAPIERAAARFLPGLRSAAAEDDLRIMNVLVLDRIGPIGFSPVAEAYRNFGPLGVAAALAFLGLVLGTIDACRDRRLAVLAIAAVYVPLLTNVRNSFVSVPAQCAAGIAMVLILIAIRHVLDAVVGKPYARIAYIRSQI